MKTNLDHQRRLFVEIATRGSPSGASEALMSIVGDGDSPMFKAQAETWHREIRSTQKRFVLLDAASRADGHVQVNGRLRLAQECCGWLDELFAARASID